MKKLTEIYVGIIIEDNGDEAIPALNLDGEWYPACGSVLKNVQIVRECFRRHQPDRKFEIFKFSNREIVCSAD